jgi:hemoglobin-like flavoprotein
MLTPTQKTLVQTTFAMVAPIADEAAQLFYRRLFELDPSLQRMFRGDMAEQRKKLMQMLTAAVKGLDHVDRLVPVIEELGRRHATYGVLDQHYNTVGAALLWALEQGLGDAFTPEVREAWAAVYGFIARKMSEAAREARIAALITSARDSRQEVRAKAIVATAPSFHAARIRPSAANVSATTAPCGE